MDMVYGAVSGTVDTVTECQCTSFPHRISSKLNEDRESGHGTNPVVDRFSGSDPYPIGIVMEHKLDAVDAATMPHRPALFALNAILMRQIHRFPL